MTRKEFDDTMKALKATQRKALSSEKAAIEALQNAGILTKTGRLARKYSQVSKVA